MTGAYIHWPFCPYRCHFCPFIAYAGYDDLMPRYNAALCQEMKWYASLAQNSTRASSPSSIFLGGGTPSSWPDNLLLDMAGILREYYDISGLQEMTIEVNPGTVTSAQFPVWKEAGITRLSIGVQSLNDGVLQSLQRQQSRVDVEQLLEEASAHFSNISVDLIIGLPGVSDEQWKTTIETACSWPITHMSIYFLTIHEGTALYRRVAKGEVTLPLEDKVVDLYLWTVEALQGHGFEQYEISNFARPGFKSLHNQVYWERGSYFGWGVGACSFDGIRRFQNLKTIHAYMEAIEKQDDPRCFIEELTPEQVYMEELMLGLRQTKGIDIGSGVYTAQVSELVDQGYVRVVDGRITLTARGLVLENEIVMKLLSMKGDYGKTRWCETT